MFPFTHQQKRHRQNSKRREHNRTARTQVRTAVKAASEAITATDGTVAQEKIRAAISALDKAASKASKGKVHCNTTSSKLARLSAQFHKAYAQKA